MCADVLLAPRRVSHSLAMARRYSVKFKWRTLSPPEQVEFLRQRCMLPLAYSPVRRPSSRQQSRHYCSLRYAAACKPRTSCAKRGKISPPTSAMLPGCGGRWQGIYFSEAADTLGASGRWLQVSYLCPGCRLLSCTFSHTAAEVVSS
jgi:hypothetical protein